MCVTQFHYSRQLNLRFISGHAFMQARNWIRELRKIIGDNIVVCIVGNKIDLEKNRTVNMKEAEE